MKQSQAPLLTSVIMLVTQAIPCSAQSRPSSPGGTKVVFQKKIADTASLIVSRRELPPFTPSQWKMRAREEARKLPGSFALKPDHIYTYTLRLRRTHQGSIHDQVLWSKTMLDYKRGKYSFPSNFRVLDAAFSHGIAVVVYKKSSYIIAVVRRFPQTNGVRKAALEDEFVMREDEAEGQFDSAVQAIISPSSKVEVLVSFAQNQRRRFLWRNYKWVEQKAAPVR